ncbi:MAG: N-acetyltransferase [Flavobacteriaceae bacterium]|nr:N-acetyltransferase [Flavobacteriaceae bacterium]MCY4266555.1 N-acetyltransferase [Flavobacteriaceae bacterium]MCY4300000.1 N-acetyltransferase [Flavobacteriaceae bacterium]
MMTDIKIHDNELLRQYETTIDGQLATIEYVKQERKIFLTKVIVPNGYSENGFVEQFINKVLLILSKGRARLVPTCPTVAAYIRKNREFKKLLPVGVKV